MAKTGEMSLSEKILNNTIELPSLPEILWHLKKTVQNPFSSLEDFGNIMEKDTALTSAVLRLVNSAFYAFPFRITSVSKACAFLGTQQLMNIALAAKTIEAFGDTSLKSVSIKSFWQHSLACACAARSIAILCREPNPEPFFTTGMMHDIGRLVMYQFEPEKMSHILEEHKKQTRFLWQLEQETFKEHHGIIGGALLQKWRLHPSQQQAVMHHHAPERAYSYAKEASILHLANTIAKCLFNYISGDIFVPYISQRALDLLKISPYSVKELINKTEETFCEIEAIFLKS